MAFVNPPSWQPAVSQTKFFEPPLPGTISPSSIDEEDSGWWGGVQQAGALIALAFSIEAAVLSGNTAITFQSQHQDEIASIGVEEVYDFKSAPVIDTSNPSFVVFHQDELSRGPVVEETYNFYDDKSVPVWDSSYPAYVAGHQDEISRGPVVDEVYNYQNQSSLPVTDTNYPAYIAPHQDEISRGPVVDEIYDFKSANPIDPIHALLDQWTQQQDEYPTQPAATIAYEDYSFNLAATLDLPYLSAFHDNPEIVTQSIVFVPSEDYWIGPILSLDSPYQQVTGYDSSEIVPQPIRHAQFVSWIAEDFG